MENTKTFSLSALLHTNNTTRNLRRSFSISRDFLNYCNYCRKPLVDGNDIYMYKGDTPFCTEECRQEQIEIDDAMEMKYACNKKKAVKYRMKNANKSTSESESRQQTSVAAAVAAS